MNDILADTHTAIWSLFDPARLSVAASRALQVAQVAGGRVLVSAVTPIETTYLAERRRVASHVLPALWAAIDDPTRPFDILSVSSAVARVLDRISRGIVSDMPDRIIAATALAHGLPLVSADRKIRSLAVLGLAIVW